MRPSPARHPGIRIHSIPIEGGVGLLFTIGITAMILISLPESRWFLAFALSAGVVVGLFLWLLHSRRRTSVTSLHLR